MMIKKSVKYIFSAILAICLAGLICYSCMPDSFKKGLEDPEDLSISVVATATKQDISYGTDCRIASIISDLDEVDLESYVRDPWKYSDEILDIINPEYSHRINFQLEAKDYIEFTFIKNIGSGLTDIIIDHKKIKTIDLYSAEWTYYTWHYTLGAFSLFNNLPLFLILACIIWVTLIIFISFLKNIKGYITGVHKLHLKEFLPGAAGLMALSFLLTIYAPLELFFQNQSNFWFSFKDLLPAVIILFVLALFISCIVLLILRISGERFYEIGTAAFFVIFICTYIQGNFLISNLPPLDGRDIDWSSYAYENLKTILVWLIVSLCVFAGYKILQSARMKMIIQTVSFCATLILCITIITVGITTNGFKNKEALVPTDKDMLVMSQDRNFILLVLDATDAGTLNELFEENPEYKDIFEDFTYYDNVVCAYPFTSRSMPFILTGVWFENTENFDDYVSNALLESPLLNELDEQSYQMSLYETDMDVSGDFNKKRFVNMVEREDSIGDFGRFLEITLQMPVIRYAPYGIKKIYYSSVNQFDETRQMELSYDNTAFSDSNISFYYKILDDEITIIPDKCFKHIHLEGAHVPYQYDEDLNIITDGTYEQNMKACLTLTKAYLQKLKDNGTFDNSAIVILGDHGYNGGYVYGRQNPIFLVKGIDEKHPMYINSAPISFDDLQSAYSRLLNGNSSEDIFDYKAGDDRERRYLFYEYLKENHMVEYIQTGFASDLDTLIPTGRTFDLKN